MPLDPAFATVTWLVHADDDPYCPEGAAELYGRPLQIRGELLRGAGHINPESGFGPWPAVERWAYGENQGIET